VPTRISIEGEKFHFNGEPTYRGRSFRGHPVEGLLFNTRMVQAIFDDENPDSATQWAYPDTGRWDPDRNVDEFIAQLPAYIAKGIRAVTINLQGGMPVTGTERVQPWVNSAFTPQGELKPAYVARAEKVLRACDAQGMGVIVGYYYFGQDENLADEAAVVRGVDNATRWLLGTGLGNILVEVNNECDVPLYEHEILTPPRIHELVERAKAISAGGRRLLVSTCFTNWPFVRDRGKTPVEKVFAAADFILFHTNGLDPEGTRKAIGAIKANPAYLAARKPIVINEDSTRVENLDAAFPHYVPWGYYDQGKNNYHDGYQSPPVNWAISTPEKQRFFDRVAEITGAVD
jgi:hypothetical protein